MPRANSAPPAPKKYRTELPIPNGASLEETIDAVREVANPILVVEFENMDLWEIREACSELEANLHVKIEKPTAVPRSRSHE